MKKGKGKVKKKWRKETERGRKKNVWEEENREGEGEREIWKKKESGKERGRREVKKRRG